MARSQVPQWLKGRRQGSTHREGRRAAARPRRPRAEVLEARLMPAVVQWINPAGGTWNTPGNWSTGNLPGATDDVVINVPSTNVTITHCDIDTGDDDARD